MKAVLFCALLLAFVAAVSCSIEVFEERGWRSVGPARHAGASDIRIMLALFMKDGAEEQLPMLLEQVSNPRSPSYGKYLTREQLAELVAPPSSHIDAAVAFLKQLGGFDLEVLASGEYIQATVPLSSVERAFQVEIHAWTHHALDLGALRLAATTLPVIPSEIKSIVQLVSGLRDLPLSLQQQRKPAPRTATTTTTGATTANGTPQVTDLTASQDRLFIAVTPTCLDGSTTQMGADKLCSDHAPSILGFQVTTTDVVSGEEQTFFVTSNSTDEGTRLTCTTAAKAATTCLVAVPQKIYRTVTIAVSSSFGSSSTGALDSPADTFYGTSIIMAPWVTPQMLRQLYNMPIGFTPLPGTGNRQAIASFSFQYWSSDDLTQYGRQLGIPVPEVKTIGFNNFNNPGDEAQLDITWIASTGLNIPSSFFSIAGGYLLEWAAKVLDQTGSDFPLVNSISYSQNEDSLATQYGTEFADRSDLDFQKIAVRGGSVLVAAGDAGATNIGHGAMSCSSFVPQYPASSPYVTTVGATGMSPSAQPLCGSVDPTYGPIPCSDPVLEVAVDASNGFVWTTGGGVSNRSTMPSWQQDAVAGYYATASAQGIMPPASLYNANGRVYPDIAAVGSNLIIVRNGVVEIAGGTSASTPITAGIMATINGMLLAQNKSPLGFINPLLYQTLAQWPGAFNDITVGTNRCGDVLHPPNVLCCPYGWPATVGFDAISGVGSVNFEQLAHYVLSVQQ